MPNLLELGAHVLFRMQFLFSYYQNYSKESATHFIKAFYALLILPDLVALSLSNLLPFYNALLTSVPEIVKIPF